MFLRPGLITNVAALSPAVGGTFTAPTTIAKGTPAAGTSPRVTTTDTAAVGDLLVAFVLNGGSIYPSGSPAFTDTAGNTWIAGTGTNSSGVYRARMFYTFVTNPVSIGDSIGPNYASSQGPYIIVAKSPASSSLAAADVSHANVSGFNTTFTLTVAARGSQPQLAIAALFSAGDMDDASAAMPATWTQIDQVLTGPAGNQFGIRVGYKRYTDLTADSSFTGTFSANKDWITDYMTFTSY